MTTLAREGYLLLIQSEFGPPPALFAAGLAQGNAVLRRDTELGPADLAGAAGVITTTHLDQIGFQGLSTATEALLARGGRWFFNGHLMRPLISGLSTYVPIMRAKRTDLVLERLAPHPLFEGIAMRDLEENKGVAGFYGRGYNPLPPGASAVTGLGPALLPVDWEWRLPGGGRMFSHAGNDLGANGAVNPAQARLAPRILAWTRGEIG